MNASTGDAGAPRARICIFAKPPLPGLVNTRLVPALGEEGAARLARAFLEDTLALACTCTWARVVVASSDPLATARVSLPPGVEEWPQGEGDLGRRVEHVLRRALLDAPAAIALGVDSPDLPRARLDAAREALWRADAAIGPASDGGFHALGLTRVVDGLLEGITWSAPTTCEETVARLRARGYRPALLPEWDDVDVPEDLARLERRLTRGVSVAPHTAAVLPDITRTRREGGRER